MRETMWMVEKHLELLIPLTQLGGGDGIRARTTILKRWLFEICCKQCFLWGPGMVNGKTSSDGTQVVNIKATMIKCNLVWCNNKFFVTKIIGSLFYKARLLRCYDTSNNIVPSKFLGRGVSRMYSCNPCVVHRNNLLN